MISNNYRRLDYDGLVAYAVLKTEEQKMDVLAFECADCDGFVVVAVGFVQVWLACFSFCLCIVCSETKHG